MLVGCLLNKVIAGCIAKYFTLEDVVKCSSLCKAMLVWRTKNSDWPVILEIQTKIAKYFNHDEDFAFVNLLDLFELALKKFIRHDIKNQGLCFGKCCKNTYFIYYVNFAISDQSFCEKCFYERNEKDFEYISSSVEWNIISLATFEQECKKINIPNEGWEKYYTNAILDYNKKIITNVAKLPSAQTISIMDSINTGHVHIPSLTKYYTKMANDVKNSFLNNK
jgi:hypothetical protein